MPKTPELETETTFVPPPKQSAEIVKVRVTKFGEGLVSTGVHVQGEGDVMASRGDILEVSKTVANSLEVRGFGEIVE